MGNPQTQDKRLEKTQGQIKNGQSRDTGNIGCTRHRTKVRKNKGQIKNGQSRDTGNIGCTIHMKKIKENPKANPEWVIQRYW
jgi:hypothetical protein